MSLYVDDIILCTNIPVNDVQLNLNNEISYTLVEMRKDCVRLYQFR